MNRTIIHADLDAFYASVEQLDDPGIRGKPVAVGGSPQGRGVVAAASYEARSFGVRSAMPMSRAMSLCPDLIRRSPRFDRYAQLSRSVMAHFESLTPLVEPLSLDEAFLDVTGWVADGVYPRELASTLRREVRASTGLALSCGVASNKSVAKIASDFAKPDGLVVVLPGDEASFLAPLPVRVLWGIGPRAEQMLKAVGIHLVADLARCTDGQAQRLLGSNGLFIRDIARGLDNRPVTTERARRSIGSESTFPCDLPDGPEFRAYVREAAVEVARRLQLARVSASTIALKVRFDTFRTATRQITLAVPTRDAGTIEAAALDLVSAFQLGDRRLRLVGIQCSKLVPESGQQGELWDLSQRP
jgi:DNA polymerase-4